MPLLSSLFSEPRSKLDVWLGSGACSAYAVNQYILKPYVGGNFITGHLNDMLAPLVLLAYSGLLARKHPAASDFLHSALGVLLLTAFAAIVWEFITPQLLSRSVADIKDVVFYLSGALVYANIHGVSSIDKESSLLIKRDRRRGAAR